MAETNRNRLFRLAEAWKLGGPATEWTTILENYLAGLDSSDAYSIAWAMSRIDVTGAAASVHAYISGAKDDDITICGMKTTNDTDSIVKCADVTGELVTLTASANGAAAHAHNIIGVRADSLASHEIVAAGTVDCLTADDATVSRTVAGALVGDLVFATPVVTDDADQVCAAAITAANTMVLTVTDDPGTDDTHSWDYMVIRPKGNFTPSHRIVFAGQHTSVGGAAAEAVTIAGVLATDLVILTTETSDDSDTVNKVVLTANTMTVTSSANPVTAHKWNYMILRAN